MSTVIVEVTADCEELLADLPSSHGWELVSENYREDGSGTIIVEFDDDDLSSAAERALDTNDGVVSYHVAVSRS